MVTSIYVDGSGGPRSGYGYFVRESGTSFYTKEPCITSNQAEYKAIIAALERFAGRQDVTIHSDSKVVVGQINHEYGINDDGLRELARRAWELIPRLPGLSIVWVPRKENLAGKMLGS